MDQQIEATIAIVPPSEAIGADLKRILSSAGHRCQFYANIRQASLELETDTTIDLVIIPLGDKERSDLDLLKQVRRSPRLHYLPVIMLCSGCDRNFAVEAKHLGATTILSLPLAEEVLLTRVRSGLNDGKRTVLVVDDEQTILDILKLSLELERFNVILALSAEEGLEILSTRKVHALVTDIMLPGMDGMALLVKTKERWPHLPVLLMTGYSGKFTPQDAIAAGADGYFSKPFKNVQMVRSLRDAIYRAEQCKNDLTATPDLKTAGRS